MKTSVEDAANQIEQLVSLPGVFVQVNQMVDDPACSVQAIGEVIARDPALTARLLRMANSVIFGFSQEIDTVSRAVMVIGTRRVRDLVLATSAVKMFDGIPNQLMNMADFWLHSIYCGLIARYLGTEAGLREPDSLFVAGLLHDIGQLVMYSQYPEPASRALEQSLDDVNPLPLYLCEHDQLGFDHAQLGGLLARRWQLPTLLVESLEFHHQPARAEAHPQQVAMVHIANTLAVLAELDILDEAESEVPAIEPVAWSRAGLDPALKPEALQVARAQFQAMYQLLLDSPAPGSG